MLFILSQEWLIDKWVEVRSFSLVWSSWRVVEHVSGSMVPSMVVIFINSQFIVDLMNKNVFGFMRLSHFWETLNEWVTLFKTWSKNKSFIRVFSSVTKNNFIITWMIWSNSSTDITSGPVINLRRYSSWFKLEWRNVSMGNWIVCLWEDELSLFSNKSHLKVRSGIFLLNELE